VSRNLKITRSLGSPDDKKTGVFPEFPFWDWLGLTGGENAVSGFLTGTIEGHCTTQRAFASSFLPLVFWLWLLPGMP
jgi:hypothetical protein